MNFNTRVRIEKKVTTTDPVYGTEVISYELLGLAWAEVIDKLPSRDEAMLTVLELASIRARLRMRFRTDLDSSMRFIIMRPTETEWGIIGGPATIGNKEGIEFLIEKKSS